MEYKVDYIDKDGKVWTERIERKPAFWVGLGLTPAWVFLAILGTLFGSLKLYFLAILFCVVWAFLLTVGTRVALYRGADYPTLNIKRK
ncbi:MAG: hypothetical protein V3U92_19595 [Cellulophaga sp.]